MECCCGTGRIQNGRSSSSSPGETGGAVWPAAAMAGAAASVWGDGSCLFGAEAGLSDFLPRSWRLSAMISVMYLLLPDWSSQDLERMRPSTKSCVPHIGIPSPGDYVVPFGVFPEIAAAVPESFRRRKRETCHLCGTGPCLSTSVALGCAVVSGGVRIDISYFRIFADIAYQHRFVE